MDDTEYFTSDSSEDELIIAENLLVHTHFILTSSCATRNGGSRSKKKPNINRVAEEGAQRLYEDYFSGASIYTDAQFRRRFRMSRKLFLKIANDVKNSNQYFIRKPNAAGQLGLNYLQKCTAAVRQLAYGIPADALDEYTRMAESTARKCLKEFCKTVETPYEKEFLRHPNEADIQRLLKENEQRGFPALRKNARSSAMQDVERAFGVLMARFAIVKNPARLWNKDDLRSIMRTCIILHNMIIEDERDNVVTFDYMFAYENATTNVPMCSKLDFSAFLTRYKQVHDTAMHYQLRNDLIEHLWNMRGEEE
ncbi:uncharacterized protein LOC129719699 [Wyeomyia smithii]|uniref:uncharacterized protein LOC129719699 n=1 Tax=Wyeomyia smithii TaxID=174621 RepID=UPI002467E7BF|nr:uncharacterized protein LOC129719699 [Wyeomyia smithii]